METSAETISIAMLPTKANGGTDEHFSILPWSQSGSTEGASTLDGNGGGLGGSFVLNMGDVWMQRASLNQAMNVILLFNARCMTASAPVRRLEWPLENTESLQHSDIELSPTFNRLDEETSCYIARRDLAEGVAWLQDAAPRFFDGANLEIDILPSEDGEDGLLALRVYGDFGTAVFRERRHQLCQAMIESGHRSLYEAISVFQRRVIGSGRQALSIYGTLSAG